MNKLQKSILALSVLSIILGCQTNTPVAEEPIEVVEEPQIIEEVQEEVEEVEEVVEEPEEINPRDMKAVYGLDFDVPIYTEEEVEQARYNLTHNYTNKAITTQEQYEKYLDIYRNRDSLFLKDQKEYYPKEFHKDYYIANQDLIYQLYDMVKDFNYVSNGNDTLRYYDEENDMFVRVSSSGTIVLISKTFEFYRGKKGDKNADWSPYEIGEKNISPDSAVLCEQPKMYSEKQYNSCVEYFEEYSGDISELEKYGFKRQKLKYEMLNIEDGLNQEE